MSLFLRIGWDQIPLVVTLTKSVVLTDCLQVTDCEFLILRSADLETATGPRVAGVVTLVDANSYLASFIFDAATIGAIVDQLRVQVFTSINGRSTWVPMDGNEIKISVRGN